jgi:hypothetical protein
LLAIYYFPKWILTQFILNILLINLFSRQCCPCSDVNMRSNFASETSESFLLILPWHTSWSDVSSASVRSFLCLTEDGSETVLVDDNLRSR